MTFLLPDPAEIRALAGRVDAAARSARARADRLGAAVAATRWRGPAARAFDAQSGVTVGALHTSAGRLDDAADALRRHADHVDHVVETLLGIVRAGLATVPELLALPRGALEAVGAGVTGVLDSAGRAATGVVSTVSDVADTALDCLGLG